MEEVRGGRICDAEGDVEEVRVGEVLACVDHGHPDSGSVKPEGVRLIRLMDTDFVLVCRCNVTGRAEGS